MDKTLKLLDYQGGAHFFIVESVDEIMCVYRYSVTGDECACIIYIDGSFVELDSGEDNSRLMDFGPEDVFVQLPHEIEWERNRYVA